MRKRVALWVLLAVVATAAFAAGQGQPAEDDGPLVIDWLGYAPVAQPEPDNPIEQAVEERYNVTFNVWYVDKQQYEEAMGVRLAAGEMPDYMLVFNPANIGRYAEQGVLAPVTEEIFAKLPTYSAIMEEYNTDGTVFDDVRYQGQVYSLPRINLQTAYPTVLCWRTDWLENVGIDTIPRTLDEFTEALTRFANDDPDGNGRDDTYGLSDSSMGAIFGAFGPIPMYRYSSRSGQRLHWSVMDESLILNVIRPEMKEALAYLNGLYEAEIIDPEFVTSENKGGYWALSHSFINGRIGLTGRQNFYHWAPPLTEGDQGGAVYVEYMAANPDAAFGETFDLGPAPIGPDGTAGAYTLGYVDVGTWSFTTRGTSDPRKVDVITSIIEDSLIDYEWSTFLNWGIEGTHYTVSEDGVHTATADYAGAPNATKGGIAVYTGGPLNPQFVKQWNPVLFDFADRYDGPKYIPTKVPATVAADRYMADLTRLATETYIAIISGSRPVDDFDEFVEMFLQNGGQEVIDEANAVYREIKGL